MALQISNTEKEAIEQLYSNIKDEFKVVKMMVFGSKARGDANEYSDIDLLVLTEKTADSKEFYRMLDYAADVNIDYEVGISCLYINNKDWEMGNVNPLLKQNIEKEGIEVVLQ